MPNPFEFLGTKGIIVNLFVSGLIGLFSYLLVGMVYEKGSFPLWGSILYTVTYSIITAEICLIFLCYPKMILLNIVFVLMVVLDFGVIWLIRKCRRDVI